MGEENLRLFGQIGMEISTAQRLFQEYDPKIQIENLRFIEAGMSTSNYVVDIKNSSQKYLLKIYPEGGGNSAVEMASYKYAAKFAKVPEVYLFDDSRKLFPRSYVILQYIHGDTLKRYIINNKVFPEEMAFIIGRNLALLHNRQYESMAMLNEELEVNSYLLPVSAMHERILGDIAGTHLSNEVREELLKFLSNNKDMLQRLEGACAFCHGDFHPSNMLVDTKDEIWFIDFEYSLAAPIYLDLGKFFRDRESMDKYIHKGIYESFAIGYNSSAKRKVYEDWIKLARLMDITGMLNLINKKDAPKSWIKETEASIKLTLRVLKGEALY